MDSLPPPPEERNLSSSSYDDDPPISFYLSSPLQQNENENKDGDPKKSPQAFAPSPSPSPSPPGPSQHDYHIPQFVADRSFSSETPALYDSQFPPVDDLGEIKVHTSVAKERKFQDVFFAVAFAISFVVMLLTLISIHAQKSSVWPTIEDKVTDMIFINLKDSFAIILLLSILSLAFGFVLMFSLRFFLEVTVWGTVALAPLVLIASSIWSFTSAQSPRKDSNAGMIVLGLASLLTAVGFSFFVYYRKKDINASISFLKLATKVLQENHSLFFLSSMTSMIYLLFSVFWYWNFNWVFLIGRWDGSSWILNPSSFVVSSFLIFMFLWTASIINYVQKFALAEVTCFWYFHRNDASSGFANPTTTALKHALGPSFGSICFASLIYSFFQFLIYLLKKFMSALPERFAWLEGCCMFCLGALMKVIDSINQYALSYCALSGENFCNSGRVTLMVFRKNLLHRVSIATISHMILSIWVVVISLLFGLSLFTYSTHTLGSAYGWTSGLMAFMISYFVLKFYSDLLLSITDTLFLCYAIDCDVNNALLGAPSSPNAFVHDTLETIFRGNQNVVVYDVAEEYDN